MSTNYPTSAWLFCCFQSHAPTCCKLKKWLKYFPTNAPFIPVWLKYANILDILFSLFQELIILEQGFFSYLYSRVGFLNLTAWLIDFTLSFWQLFLLIFLTKTKLQTILYALIQAGGDIFPQTSAMKCVCVIRMWSAKWFGIVLI